VQILAEGMVQADSAVAESCISRILEFELYSDLRKDFRKNWELSTVGKSWKVSVSVKH